MIKKSIFFKNRRFACSFYLEHLSLQINNAYTLLFMSDAIENQEEQILSEETVKETDKKCPNCGATVVFDRANRRKRCNASNAVPSVSTTLLKPPLCVLSAAPPT